MEFKYRLRDLRREKNISGEELGEKVGVKKTAISQWENGRNYPNQGAMKKLMDYFDVSYEYLMGNSDIRNSSQVPSPDEIDINSIEFALYGEVKELTEEDKQYILETVKFLRARKK